MKRSEFIKKTALGSLTAGTVITGFAQSEKEKYTPLSIGLCADLHHDLIFDSEERLAAFIGDMAKINPDFIIQLGDFCFPDPGNQAIMDIWNKFPGSAHHVIGNHDPEGRFTQDDVVKFWNLNGKYYSFDMKGYHFIVLNGNETNPEREIPLRYERYISDQQLAWLEKDLKSTEFPSIIFCHQGLDNSEGIENAQRIRLAFEDANNESGFRKVQIVFTGHHHKDYHNVINGIHYIQVNSISYHWQGDKYVDQTVFSDDLIKEYPHLRRMAYYREPLWAVAEISANGMLSIHGRSTEFMGKSPHELGMPVYEYGYPVTPVISNRQIQLTRKAFSEKFGC